MIELKPCPFCGGKAYLFVDNGIRVYCSKCKSQTIALTDSIGSRGLPYGQAVNSVIEKWNTRPIKPLGLWQEEGCGLLVCSHCKYEYDHAGTPDEGFAYCPNCGIEMEVPENAEIH